jgi:hypothetical protein
MRRLLSEVLYLREKSVGEEKRRECDQKAHKIAVEGIIATDRNCWRLSWFECKLLADGSNGRKVRNWLVSHFTVNDESP